VLLTTVEVNTQAMAASPEKYTGTMQITLLLSFFEKRKGLHPLWLHHFYMTHDRTPLVYPIRIIRITRGMHNIVVQT